MDRKIEKEDVRKLFDMSTEEFQANMRGLSGEERHRVSILLNEISEEERKKGKGLYDDLGKLMYKPDGK